MSTTKKRGLLFFVGALSLLALSKPANNVLADRLESDSFVIQFGNFNVTSGEKSSASFNVTDTVGQIAAGPFGEYGNSDYFLGSGFQYIYQIDTFSFSISDVLIELGSLSNSAFSTDSNVLTITTKGGGGYTVYSYESRPLTLSSDGVTTIPDTTCDTASCDQTNADPWVTPSNYGFGFNADGSTVPSDFVDTTYFRQFADASSAETMQAVMSSSNIANADTATITYKASAAGNQTAGEYETAIIFVAVPGF